MILLSRLPLCLRRPIVWLLRLRHRRGYGIHSPFAFAKVTGVFFERGTFYAYAPLMEAHPQAPRGMTHGDLRLLLRLSNETHPRHGIIVDEIGGDAPADYLAAGCRTCRWTRQTHTAAMDEAVDFLYIDMSGDPTGLLQRALPRLTDSGTIVVHGIRQNGTALRAWRWLQQRDEVRVTFDLFDFGIAYTERRLNKEDYIICYP